MTSQEQAIKTLIPDLRNVPVGQVESGALAEALATYRERLKENGIPLSSFQARI